MLNKDQIDSLQWAVRCAKEWRGAVPPDEMPEYDIMVRYAQEAVTQLRKEAVSVCNVAKPASPSLFTGQPQGVVHPELFNMLIEFDNTITKAVAIYEDIHPREKGKAFAKLQRKKKK